MKNVKKVNYRRILIWSLVIIVVLGLPILARMTGLSILGSNAGASSSAEDLINPKNIDVEKLRPYSKDSFWNTPIGPNPKIDFHSKEMIATIGLDNQGKIITNPDEYGRTFYIADSSTPRYTLHCERYSCTLATASGATKTDTIEVPIPDGAEPPGGTDGSVVIIDKDTLDEYNLWGFKRNGNSIRIQNGSRYNLLWDGTPDVYGSGGAGIPYAAGVIRPWEIAQGHIDHVIGFSYPYPADSHCVFPASKTDGHSLLPYSIPEGAHLQLDPSLTDADFKRMGLSTNGIIIAKTLQKYGMVLVNYAGRPKFYVENLTDNPLAKEKWSDPEYKLTSTIISNIPYTSFRVLALPDAYWDSTKEATMHGLCYAYPSTK